MNTVYSDIDQDNAPRLVLKTNVKSVQQSVWNIFNTVPGQRFFNPEFGTDLDQILFELADDVTALNIESIMSAAVAKWDPRVEYDSSRSTIVADPDNNRFVCTLVYTIRGFSDQIYTFNGVVNK